VSQAGGGREEMASRAVGSVDDPRGQEHDVADLLVEHTVQLLTADAAGILLADARRELRVMAASSEDAMLMELLQLQSDEGPCVDCFHGGSPVGVVDLTQAGDRWPAFVAAAADRGAFRSVHTLPLRLRGETIGALDLFYREPGSPPDVELGVGQALADVATIAIVSERAARRAEVVNEQLQSALHSRVIIEQAKGVLAGGGALGMDAAFDRLRRYARDRGLRLSEVARQVVETDLATAVLGTDSTRKSAPR
jgi:GAF domain-containing protein